MSKEQGREALAAEAHRLLCKFGADTVRASMFTTDENVGAMAESERAAKEAIARLAALASPAAEPVQAMTQRQIGDIVTAIKPYPLDLVMVPAEQVIALVRGVEAALASPPATKEAKAGWIPVSERLPESGVTVLAAYTNRAGMSRRIRAQWVAAKSMESDSDSEIGEYDEATDTFYDPEGWYECIDNWCDYTSVAVVEGEISHWMPLPPAPEGAA